MWVIHMNDCDMTHSYESFICVTWLIHSFIWVPRLTHMCDMTHSPVWHVSFICVAWLIHICDMTHLYMWHDSFICVPWLIHMRDMTHSYVWHDSFTCVTWHTHMRDMTYAYVWYHAFTCVTWLIHMRVMYESGMYESHMRVLYQSVWISHVTQMMNCTSDAWESYVWQSYTSNDPFICFDTLLIGVICMTVLYESFICFDTLLMSNVSKPWMGDVAQMLKCTSEVWKSYVCKSYTSEVWKSFESFVWIHMNESCYTDIMLYRVAKTHRIP